jgi:diguanylate cyclase
MTMDERTVQQLVREIERKDASTAAHTWRVVLYARAMAESLGLPRRRIETITRGAALHDIGKLCVPDAILRKPGPLTGEEFAVIQQHATHGHERLVALGETDADVLDLVRHHHERWDGAGYPDGLAGESVSLGARVFAVIDSFDALTSVRPYRRDIGEGAAERALAILEDGKGSRYWPEAVDLFASLYRGGGLTWILHYFNDRVPVPEFKGHTMAEPTGGP